MKKNILISLLVVILLTNIMIVKGVETPKSNYNYLFIGNGDYEYLTRLKGPEYDLKRLEDVFKRARYRFEKDKNIRSEYNLEKNEIIEAIRETFKDSKDEDVNFFYYGGHGIVKNGIGYITGVEAKGEEGFLSAKELRKELDKVKGTKVIILDSCYSGSFIGEKRSAESELDKLNESFIDEFSRGNTRSFYGNEYKVLTAAAANEPSWDVRKNEYYQYGGEFTIALIDGLGYRGEVFADSEKTNQVSLENLYRYSYNNTPRSSVQVYPRNDNFIIYEYDSEIELESLEIEDRVLIELKANKKEEILYKVYKEDLVREEKVSLYPGFNTIAWDGKDNFNKSLSDGLYRIVLETKEGKIIKDFYFHKFSKYKNADIKLDRNSTDLYLDLYLERPGQVVISFFDKEQKLGELNLGRQERDRELYKIDLKEIGILKTPNLKVLVDIK